jgi:hypothetical protein
MDKKLINQALLIGMGAIGGFMLYKAYKSKTEQKSGFSRYFGDYNSSPSNKSSACGCSSNANGTDSPMVENYTRPVWTV